MANTTTAPPSKLFDKYGPWAVVTGASSGIGRELARELAASGFDLVVTARRLERLESLAAELNTAHGTTVKTVRADLSTADGVEAVLKAGADVDFGLVVSNAGAATPGAFLATSLEDQLGFVQLNVSATVELAHGLGATMAERGRGGFILVGSTASFAGAPYLANYAASKAFVGSFGEALGAEWSDKGVDVLVVHPGPTRTEMVEMDGVDFDKMPARWMEPAAVARKALKSLGRRPVLVPGGMNKFMKFFTTRLLPRRATVAVWGSMMGKVTDDHLLS